MNDITIRIAESSDVSEIQRLYQQLDRHHADILPMVFQPVDSDVRADDVILNWINRDDAVYLLAEMSGKVIGFLHLKRAAHPNFPVFRKHEYARIEDAIIDKSYRGRGIGKMLLNAAVKWVKDQGIKHIQLLVWQENAAAVEFYLNQGFKPINVKMEMNIE